MVEGEPPGRARQYLDLYSQEIADAFTEKRLLNEKMLKEAFDNLPASVKQLCGMSSLEKLAVKILGGRKLLATPKFPSAILGSEMKTRKLSFRSPYVGCSLCGLLLAHAGNVGIRHVRARYHEVFTFKVYVL